MFRNVVVAGTFDVIHSGHKALLLKALSSGKRLTVGITTDSFATRRKPYPVNPFSVRKANMQRFLSKHPGRVILSELNDKFGPSTTSGEFDALVVSPETEPNAIEINRIRTRNRLPPLSILSVPVVYAEDFKKISCRRIIRGEISPDGRRLKKVIFSIGTKNRQKFAGAKAAIPKLFKNFSAKAVPVKSGVRPLPFGETTLLGAINRARSAYRKGKPDFGIGLESGFFRIRRWDYVFLWCAIFDGGEFFLGSSMGIPIPGDIAREARKGKLPKILPAGSKRSTLIEALSKGLLTRKDMAGQACSCALAQLSNRGIFGKW